MRLVRGCAGSALLYFTDREPHYYIQQQHGRRHRWRGALRRTFTVAVAGEAAHSAVDQGPARLQSTSCILYHRRRAGDRRLSGDADYARPPWCRRHAPREHWFAAAARHGATDADDWY